MLEWSGKGQGLTNRDWIAIFFFFLVLVRKCHQYSYTHKFKCHHIYLDHFSGTCLYSKCSQTTWSATSAFLMLPVPSPTPEVFLTYFHSYCSQLFVYLTFLVSHWGGKWFCSWSISPFFLSFFLSIFYPLTSFPPPLSLSIFYPFIFSFLYFFLFSLSLSLLPSSLPPPSKSHSENTLTPAIKRHTNPLLATGPGMHLTRLSHSPNINVNKLVTRRKDCDSPRRPQGTKRIQFITCVIDKDRDLYRVIYNY